MKVMKHMKTAAAAATLAVVSAPAMAADNELLNTITTELGGLKVGKRGSGTVG